MNSLLLKLPLAWASLLEKDMKSQYMQDLLSFLDNEFQNGVNIRPNPDFIFRALETVSPDQVKVVIIGQDPYHGQSQANGLAFAVNNETDIPPSLANIFKEIYADLGRQPKDRTLVSWAKQGVLLLNTVLTTRQGEAFAHRGKGWETFTDTIIKLLGNQDKSIVFLLWGAAAQAKKTVIKEHHHIFMAPHPSPLSAYRGFLGCKHFSKTNMALLNNNILPIDWTA